MYHFSDLSVADEVLWSPDGAIYLVIIGDKINIYDITTATITDTIVHSSAIHAVTFIEVSSSLLLTWLL